MCGGNADIFLWLNTWDIQLVKFSIINTKVGKNSPFENKSN